ncbi:MAG: glutathione-disulfide reductase [Gammaproteobacteria bacterium]|jgi:glutathione reductase (NADPH)
MSRHFDLVAIGGGSGGLAVSKRAAGHGAKAAVVESGRLGGTCVNVGCVPKKVMWNAATIAHALHDAEDYGFSVSVGGHDWGELKSRRDAYVERLNHIHRKNLERAGVEFIPGRARLTGPRSLQVGEQEITADHIVVATGGFPVVPAIPGADWGITSDGFFELGDRPERVLIAGSGYVAVELAGVFAALGSAVTVMVRYDSVLRSFDSMLQQALLEEWQRTGVELVTTTLPERVERHAAGLKVWVHDGRTLDGYDCLIWAIGRAPATSRLGLAAAGVETDQDGFIPTDDYQNTNVESIYAIGDVTGREALTPVAIAAGRRLADRLFGGMADRKLDYENIPTVIFSHPPIGTVGMTEAEARTRYGDSVRVYTSRFVGLYNAITTERPVSAMKLVTAGPDERIVGCHVIGQGADEMLQGFAVAVRMGACKRDFDETVAIHPTSAEEFVTMQGPPS